MRCPKNPLIKPADVIPSVDGLKVVGVFNPAAIEFGDEILLLLRVAEACESHDDFVRVPICEISGDSGMLGIAEFLKGDPKLKFKDSRGVVYDGKEYLSSISHLRLARSKDGLNFKVDEEPFILPEKPYERYGVEDPRIIKFCDRYFINYTAVSDDSWCTALASTKDFISYERHGIIFHPENKDVAIFPEMLNGKFSAFHRPNNSGFGKPSIWYSESPDLIHWGNHKCILKPDSSVYETSKIGAGAPPVKTDHGWLMIYHSKDSEGCYYLHALLTDLKKPWKIIGKSSQPILSPEMSYELNGFCGNVVFSNGVLLRDGKLFIYYGSADEFTCLSVLPIEELMLKIASI